MTRWTLVWMLLLLSSVAQSFDVPQPTARTTPRRQHNPACTPSAHPHLPTRQFRKVHSTTTSTSLNMLEIANAEDASSFLQNRDVWVFLAGIFPFAWATIEFWRRIAVGEPFGTGSDSVVIGIDDAPADSRGRRILGKDALVTAYILFALAFGTIGIVLYSVITSEAPPEVLPSMVEQATQQ